MSGDGLSRGLASVPAERAAALIEHVHALSPDDLLWLSGYAAGVAAARRGLAGDVAPAMRVASAPAQPPVTVLYGTHSGTSRALAERLGRRLADGGAAVRVIRASDYDPRELVRERTLFVVVATHGDGDPADDTRALFDVLAGKRAPKLPELRFAVLGLGDSSYPKFCHVARLFDARLAELGGRRLHPRGECDVDVEPVAGPWLEEAARLGLADGGASASGAARGDGVVIPLHAAGAAPAAVPASVSGTRTTAATRAQPAIARVLANQAITARGAGKQVRHLELAIDEATLAYQPGDALAIWPTNPSALVDELVAALGARADAPVARDGRERPLAAWLTDTVELTRLARPFLAAHAERAGGAAAELVAALAPGREDALAALIASHQVIDVLTRFPAAWTPAELVAALRPLAPRSYSIASSPRACPGEAHLTVALVEDVRGGRRRVGAASAFLAGAADDAPLRAFVEPNPSFRLPAADDDVIMIGPGTGVAPYRGFLQDREATGARGRSWLFFGEQRRRTTFLYQLEWQRALARGVLTRMDVAFSRDQPAKIYVQDRLRERGAELFAWLAGGAHLYLCGDAKRMAPAIEAALCAIAARHGGLDDDGAAAWLAALRAGGRYHRDVY